MKKELAEKIKRLQTQLTSVSYTRASIEILTTSNNHNTQTTEYENKQWTRSKRELWIWVED